MDDGVRFMLDGVIDLWRFVVFAIVMTLATITMPIWIIPYLIYKRGAK